MFLISQRGVPQIADHFVDVVLDECNLALRFHLNRTRQIALGDCGRDINNCTKLCSQVRCQSVNVIGQISPCARGARHVRLAAEFSFHAHFSRDGRNLLRECRQRVDHVVDRLGELGNFALGFEEEFALQIAVCHCRHDLCDATHLISQVRRHKVDVVGEILPRSRNAFH